MAHKFHELTSFRGVSKEKEIPNGLLNRSKNNSIAKLDITQQDEKPQSLLLIDGSENIKVSL